MDQASEGKAIALQLQDVQALLDQENTNDEEGEISDQRMAMQTYQENLMRHLTFLGDARMARSFANAVQSDDQILADACEDEKVAANDQLLAQRLAGVAQPKGPAASYPKIDLDDAEPSNLAQFNRTEPVLSSSPTTATSVDKARDVGEIRGIKRERELSVAEDDEGRSKTPKVEILNTLPVLSSKRKRSPSPHGQVEASSLATSVVLSLGNGEEAQNSVTSNKRVRTSTLDERVNEEQIACISCGEPDPGTHLSLENCKHCYCKECVISWVEAALDPGSTFPPVCCNHQITLEVVEPYISLDLASRFKMQEKISLAAACPLICAEPGCLVGISTQNIVGDKGHCLACKRNTCNKCRMGWHEDEECVADEERALIMGMAKKEGWQSCFRCGNLVELNTGCYHMM